MKEFSLKFVENDVFVFVLGGDVQGCEHRPEGEHCMQGCWQREQGREQTPHSWRVGVHALLTRSKTWFWFDTLPPVKTNT
mmetsp:Transcript_9849/g.19652  ORF Transcript_9849/g.19652 Transcript_9849/m.19652 type:complete len:80 (-) Transcript_9849:1175-1414(-)